MPSPGQPPAVSPRDRFRSQMRDEIKAVALRQLAEGGPAGISVNAIGRELGVSGPALYRYFASRDALLTELVLDAYADLAAALREAVARRGRRPAAERLRALGRAYRAWAIAQPHRYGLLFGPPLPGQDAHSEPIVAASEASMAVLLEVLSGVDEGALPTPGRRLARELAAWSRTHELPARPPVALRAVTLWARLHGIVALELGGNFASMGLDPEALFEAELRALAG